MHVYVYGQVICVHTHNHDHYILYLCELGIAISMSVHWLRASPQASLSPPTVMQTLSFDLDWHIDRVVLLVACCEYVDMGMVRAYLRSKIYKLNISLLD